MKTIKSISTMTVYELRMRCKEMKLKRYSHLRKNELIILIENEMRNKYYEGQKNDKSIFCYPEVLKEIYSYLDFDDIDKQRKERIEKSEKNLEIYDKHLANVNKIKNNRKKRKYALENGFNSVWQIKQLLEEDIILSLEYKILIKSKKEVLYIWLKTLSYKVTRKVKKAEMRKLVEKYYKELI